MKKFILGMKSWLINSIEVTGTNDEKLTAYEFIKKYKSISKDTLDWYVDINGKMVLIQQIESIETIEREEIEMIDLINKDG
ncbi:MAG: hypothetical protein PHP92_05020 [Candidatus Nanoarchaeia archaeon]|nr:hypothetical protein [Candidatus Nanoarchaeia archaeon]